MIRDDSSGDPMIDRMIDEQKIRDAERALALADMDLEQKTEHVSRLIREDGNMVMLAAFKSLMEEVHKELATVDAGLAVLQRELEGAIALSQEWHR